MMAEKQFHWLRTMIRDSEDPLFEEVSEKIIEAHKLILTAKNELTKLDRDQL